MAERSTWAETHLNAVNKLLCWDRSFLGKATRSVGTSHIPASRAVHLAVRRERQVGGGGGEAVSDTAVETGSAFHRTSATRLTFCEPFSNPVQFQNSDQPSAYREALGAKTCDTDADVPVILAQKDEWESKFHCRACTKTKRSAIRQRSAPISTAVS